MFLVQTLKKGKSYLFRGENLSYQGNKKGYRGRIYTFKTAAGETRQICRILVQSELWEPIEND